MEASTQDSKNPLGLSLDFMFGRGYLWAQRQRLSDWIALESLRMEIPDLQFPFDARTGLDRFRHTRCLVREVEFAISEVGLGDLLAEAASHLEGFEELQVRFLEDAAHISLKLNAFGSQTYLSFRAAMIPPEPARADEVHLSLYGYRAYGPLPYPARLVAHELLTSLLNTPVLRASGRGSSFTVGIAGDIVSFRPLKLLFLHIFPRVGWKLPNLSGVVLESVKIRPGVMTIRAVDVDPQGARERRSEHHLATTTEGARALAAYEAKELFSHADQALFEGQMRQAISLLSNYRDVYGLHPALVTRLLDCLIADPSPGHLAEAESIRRELLAEDPDDLQAAMVGPVLALARRRNDEAIEAFFALSEQLQHRRQTRDWILCELALAELLAADKPEEAAKRLREVLKRDPRNKSALEVLRGLYERLGEKSGLEETLKRLTGVYTDRETLKATYLQLARHLMDREGDLGEARIYLEKVLRLDATELEALYTLGESYVLGGEPLRALKAFGSAARAAESEGLSAQGSRLHFRVGAIWYEELEDPRQGLLGFRRALALSEAANKEDGEKIEVLERVSQLRRAAEMCEELSRDDEATDYWSEIVPALERFAERAGEFGASVDIEDGEEEESWREELVDAHRHLGEIYDRRERWAAAASHYRRWLELRPRDEDALKWLENYLRQGGQPEELLDLYSDLLAEADDEGRRLILIGKRAEIYAGMGLWEEAQMQYRSALEIDPTQRDVRLSLVELLTEHRRFDALRDALNSVLVRTTDRDERWEISMELGRANEALGDEVRAARSYMEAVKLRPGRVDALEGGCRVMEKVIEDEGASSKAPIGTKTAGKLLENLLIRLAEVAPSVAQQREVLLKVGLLASERGDEAAAMEARERAQELKVELDGDSSFVDIDARLDARLDEMLNELANEKTDALPEGGPRITVKPKEDEEGGEPEHLTSFRKNFHSMLKKPAPLPKSEEVAEGSALSAILRRNKKSDEKEDQEEPKTMQMPVFRSEDLRQMSEGKTRELPRPFDFRNRAGGTSKSDTPESGKPQSDEPVKAGTDEGSTSPRIHTVQMALSSLGDVRQNGDVRQVAEAIETVLSLAEETDSEILAEDQWSSLRREAGELFYYDLEDGDAALVHLEELRRIDPQGAGAATGVVNALESIYEERGEVGARVALLEERLKEAQTKEMATTYRLLLAQVLWDQEEDAEGARKWLNEVLTTEAEHEAAHRLMADMASAQKNWEAAAEHLEVVVRVAGGGIDAVESQRELADLYLNRLDSPEKARDHYEKVLEAAPGDSMALEGIKESQATRGEWDGYVESLGRELGLLIGKPQGLALEEIVELEASSVVSALRVPASQIVADAAHIVEEELQRLEVARKLWGLTFALWPEHVEALERRIVLDRSAKERADLAEDLESLAAMLLNIDDRFDALVEVAALRAEVLEDREAARPLYAEAIALVQDREGPPEGLDAARRALKRLQTEHDEF